MFKLLFIVAICVVIFLIIAFKVKVAKNKPAEQRTAFEKILATLLVKHQMRMDEAANTIRTASISREEGIQKCKEAIRNLETDYKQELANLIRRRDELKDKLPELKTKPGLNEGKARNNKKKMEEAQAEGQTELAEQYKANAMMFLDLKKKALDRIERSEKFLREIKVTIEKSKAQYEMRSALLSDTLAEFESMVGPISKARFNTSMEQIQSLRRETVDKIRNQNSEIEAGNMINESGVNETEINSSAYEDEFNKL